MTIASGIIKAIRRRRVVIGRRALPLMSIRKLAIECGVSERQMWRYVSGEIEPNDATIERLREIRDDQAR